METQGGRYDSIDNRYSNLELDDQESSSGNDGEDDQMRIVRDLVGHIKSEVSQVVPIISNSMRADWILDYDFNNKLGEESGQNDIETPELAYIEQVIARVWAKTLKDGYPFRIPRVPEYYQLARVAQYRQIIPENDHTDPDLADIRTLANSEYLRFLKLFLYKNARDDPHSPASLVKELGVGSKGKKLIDQYSFSDLAQDLGYPRSNAQYPDLLSKLAKLPLPVYITTSYFDFLERLLQSEGKKPQTQICFYKGEPANIPSEHKTRDIIPSVSHPVVYHLYGYEKYPSSLVFSEGDYLDFLTAMANDHNSKAPIVPLYIRNAITYSAVLVLGYRLLSWDFRILFRSLLNGQEMLKDNVALQIDPEFEEAFQDNDRALSYIKQYFKSAKFSLAVGNTVDFVKALWEEWERRR